jgi:SAM-dependent methyltransferase
MNYERIYQYRFRDLAPGERDAVWVEIATWLYERFGRPQRVLDPAAGLGEFIRNVPADERWAVDMVDHGLTAIAGVRAQICPLQDADLPADHFDMVFASNLLEHLPTQEAVADLLGRLHGTLRPGGRLVVMGPNFRYAAKEYFDCADHVLALTHVSVAEHLYGAGFEVDTVVDRFLPYSFRSRLPASPALTRRYLQTPPAWKVLGKQLLVAGVREV